MTSFLRALLDKPLFGTKGPKPRPAFELNLDPHPSIDDPTPGQIAFELARLPYEGFAVLLRRDDRFVQTVRVPAGYHVEHGGHGECFASTQDVSLVVVTDLFQRYLAGDAWETLVAWEIAQ